MTGCCGGVVGTKGEDEKRIPPLRCGMESKRVDGVGKQIRSGNEKQRRQRQRKKQIPFGNDKQRG